MLALGFHRVERPTGLEITRLSPGRFARLLDLIDASTLPVSHPDLSTDSEDRGVLLTFDDGYQSIAENALPQVVERGWGALVFLIAGSVGKTDDWDVRLLGRRRRMMTWPAVKEWAAAGIEFGSHTLTHADLTVASPGRLERELLDARMMIEDQIGKRVRYLAYPFGRQTLEVRNAARQAGYEAAFAAGRGEATDVFAIPRAMIHGLTSIYEFRAALDAEANADNQDKRWRGSRRSRFFQSLSAGSAVVANWRDSKRHRHNQNERNCATELAAL